jgi:hypothetical protein
MSDATITMVDLESRLASDPAGSARDQICEALADWRAEARRYIDAGLPPAEFVAASRWAEALDAAAAVVTKYWKMKQPAAPTAWTGAGPTHPRSEESEVLTWRPWT